MELEVAILSVEEPAPETTGGVKLALAFAGTPLMEKLTVPAKPLVAMTVAVNAVLPPTRTDCEAGDAVNAKSLTTALNERLLVHMPSVAEIVMSEAPVWPATGVMVMVRLVPLSPTVRSAFGTRD